VNPESAQIARNPPPLQLLRHRRRRAAAAKAVQHEVALVRGGFENAFKQGFGFLRCVTNSLVCLRIDWKNIFPQVISRRSGHLVKKKFQPRHLAG
jgi:hypothetical protein